MASAALKVVVDKGSLRVALMQRSVGPKCLEKSNSSKVTSDTKGKWVYIPILWRAGRSQVTLLRLQSTVGVQEMRVRAQKSCLFFLLTAEFVPNGHGIK
jgi:hypothetical protein